MDVIAPVSAGEPYALDAHFRDSHVDADGVETVVHEYGLTATVDSSTLTVLTIDATANVLPWQECPGVVSSASRLVGTPVTDLRQHMRREFKGPTTCTHLNDVLRLLADVEYLVRACADR